MNDLTGKLLEAGRKFAERPAINARGTDYTYQTFYEKVGQLTAAIQRHNPTGARIIGVQTSDDLNTYASLLAAIFSGNAYMPVNENFPWQRNLEMIKQADVRTLLVHEMTENIRQLKAQQGEALTIIETHRCDEPLQYPQAPQVSEDDLAYLLFTSGSTGKPKGVPISHKNLTAFATAMLEKMGYAFDEKDRYLQMFELTFDLSVFCIFLPLLTGASFHVAPKGGIKNLVVAELLMERQLTVVLLVPSVLRYLQPWFSEFNLPELRYSFFCGEALPDDLMQKWQPCIPNGLIVNLYGPAEGTVSCTRYEWDAGRSPQAAENGTVPIGKAFPGVEVWLEDEQGQRARQGEKGELVIAGGQITSGYWRFPEKTAQCFFPLEGTKHHAYRTGDICRQNEMGDYIFYGRRDHQVKIDGYRVELGEIEHEAKAALKTEDLVVLTATDATGKHAIYLFVKGEAIDEEQLMEQLKEHLPAYMIPEEIFVLDQFPQNMSEKIDRKALKALLKKRA